MAALTRAHIKDSVLPVVHQATLDDMNEYVLHEPRVSLQGSVRRTETFYADTVLLTLYHDITGHGNTYIHDRVKNWYNIGHNTVGTNVGRMRKELGRWGMQQIERGDLEDWESCGRLIKFNKKDLRF